MNHEFDESISSLIPIVNWIKLPMCIHHASTVESSFFVFCARQIRVRGHELHPIHHFVLQ